MSGADISKSKLTTSLSRLSKMDILAQKQNRIADRKLSDAITSIDRERAAFKVNHRSLLQELRWELQDVRSSTGHSDKGRPPTVDELQRMKTWMPSRHSGGAGQSTASRQRGAPPLEAAASHRGGLLPLREVFSPVREGTPPEYAYSDTDSDDGLAAATYGSVKPSTTCERDDRQHASAARDASTSGDGRERLLNEASSSPKPLQRPHSSGSDDLIGEQAAATAAASAAADAADEHDSPEEGLVTGKLEEMKRIMKMPTIYQTQELQKQRGLPRHVVSLPPIKFFDDDDYDATEEKVAAVHRGVAAVGHARRDERHLLLPELLSTDGASGGGGSVAKADGSHTSSNKVLPVALMSAELPSEAKKAKAAAAAVAQAPLRLTKATSVGTVYKPDNIRFVGRSFTKEELVTQHRSLLEQNRTERDVNPGKVQMTRLQSRVDAFLSLVSVAPAGSTGRGGGSKTQTQLPPVALGSGAGVPTRLTVVEKRRSGAR